ncbi:MAG TPA: adenylate/guanylate cyclase domain-containing protein, partial [Actinomycetota bacterium]|nr:adenylate/guanylate cyclase domain-containing protein [Actinomycetota bacterium]
AYALALLGEGHTGLAYLLKDRLGEGDDLARAIRAVNEGGSLVDPTIAARLSGRKDSRAEDRELLDLMARGLGYAEMAEELGTTQEAVDRRITETFARLAGEADRGASGAVRMLKELHAAVIDREASARVLREFVPSQVAERLGSTPLEPEEVEATILFSDIRGFTTLSERLPPKELATVLATHLSAMAEVVLAHGGTIDKFAGDAVMAVFGAPDPVPDHAERALRCALAMQARQAELNAAAELPLEMGIGVNTGVVVAGTVGGAGRLEYTVVGDAVNVAQRLQSVAGPGEVVASAETVAGAPGMTVAPAGAQEVKGRRQPVEVYRVTGS